MPRFEIAHLREQGQDMIIVPVDDSFGTRSDSEQDGIVAELQSRASAAGLAGIVVPVWQSGSRMAFIAPANWHPFFQSMSPDFVAMNLNRELYW